MTFKDDVIALQRRVGAPVDGDFGPTTLAAVNRALDGVNPVPAASDISPKQNVREITSIAVHCSATKEGQHFTASDIDGWHRKQGWAGIGYNAVVLLDGTIQLGRAENKVPSHAVGFNANSIAICYIGGVSAEGRPKDTRTSAQKASLLRWLKAKKAQYPGAEIKGHNNYPGVIKACPSFDAKAEYAGL